MLDITTYILARRSASIIAQQAVEEIEPEVIIEESSGTLPPDVLAKIVGANAAYIKLENKIYRLSRIETNNYKFINSYTDGSGQVVSMIELDIDKTSGEFTTKPLIIQGSSVADLERRLEEHINDNNIHVSENDRAYWNNKVSAEVIEIAQGEYDYKLHLKK